MTKIAIGQLCSSSNMIKNLEIVTSLIADALKQDVKLIFFPEATDYISQDFHHSKKLSRQTSKFVQQLQLAVQDLVLKYSKPIDVSIGVHLPSDENDNRIKNVLLYINHKGEIIHKYQKMHLFDVDIINGPVLKESTSIQPGNELPQLVSTPAGKLGTAICYDIRFPELSLKLRSMGAELICFPSAFTNETGRSHWKALGVARALDTQCYIIMANQQGEHDVCADEMYDKSKTGIKRVSWGHSMIIGPWGDILSEADSTTNSPQLITANIDLDIQKEIRRDMPLWDQRRRDIFGDFF